MKWMKTIGAIVGAILLVLAGAKAQSKTNAAKRKEDRAAQLLNSGVSKHIAKASALTASAAKDKEKAIAAKEKMKTQLEKLGESNADLDAIAHDFNSRRLRK